VNFGWYEEADNEVESKYGKEKVELAMKYRGREIYLKDFGCRSTTNQDTVMCNKESPDEIPNKYLQTYYGEKYNGCVWLSVCRLLYYMHPEQGELLVNKYLKSPQDYDMLKIFEGRGKNKNSLYTKMMDVEYCLYRVQRPKFNKHEKNDITNNILNTRTAGYFIVVLCDNYNGTTHAVGIDCGQKQLHDPMVSNILPLSRDSLSIACGDGRTFQKFAVVAELYRYAKKWSNTRKIRLANQNSEVTTLPEEKQSKI